MATLIPRRFRAASQEETPEPSWFKKQVTGTLQTVSRRACAHPIHTIVAIALLASTTYVGLLEGSIFDAFRHAGSGPGQVNPASFLHGSRVLRLGEKTAWRWQIEDNGAFDPSEVGYNFPLCLH